MKYTQIVNTTAALGSVFALIPSFAQAQGEAVGATNVQGVAVVGQATAAKATTDPTGRQGLPVVINQDQVLLRELEKITVSKIELKNVSSEAALMMLMEPLELGYEFDNAFYVSNPSPSTFGPLGGGGFGNGISVNGGQTLDLPPRNITMRILNAPVNKALDSLTNAIGIGWLAEKRGSSITIRFVKLRNTVTYSDMVNRLAVSSGQNTAYGTAASPGTAYSGMGGTYVYSGGRYVNMSSLPPTLVKLDVRDKPVREALRTVLEAAKLEFAIDEDVPADLKKTFAFDGVHISTALSVICQSAAIGWRGEQTPNGILIRISKRYAPPPAQKSEEAPESIDPIR